MALSTIQVNEAMGRVDRMVATLYLMDPQDLDDCGREMFRRKAAELVRAGFDLLETVGVDSWRWDDCVKHVVALVNLYAENSRRELVAELQGLLTDAGPVELDLSSVVMHVVDEYNVSPLTPVLEFVRFLRSGDEGHEYYNEHGVALGRFDATDIGEPETVNEGWAYRTGTPDQTREITLEEVGIILAHLAAAPGFSNVRPAFIDVAKQLRKTPGMITITGEDEGLGLDVEFLRDAPPVPPFDGERATRESVEQAQLKERTDLIYAAAIKEGGVDRLADPALYQDRTAETLDAMEAAGRRAGVALRERQDAAALNVVQRWAGSEADAGVNNGAGDLLELIRKTYGGGGERATLGDFIDHLDRTAPEVTPLVHSFFRSNDWLTKSLKVRAFYEMVRTGQIKLDPPFCQAADVAPDEGVGAAPLAEDPEAVRGGPNA